MSGTFALYVKPDGGMHLVYKDANTPDEQHIDVPTVYINMLGQMRETGMNPLQMIGGMMKANKETKKARKNGLD